MHLHRVQLELGSRVDFACLLTLQSVTDLIKPTDEAFVESRDTRQNSWLIIGCQPIYSVLSHQLSVTKLLSNSFTLLSKFGETEVEKERERALCDDRAITTYPRTLLKGFVGEL